MPDVIMPKMGDSMEIGKLLSWRKHSGETVKSGEIIAEIETDKSNVEIEAEDDGVLVTNIQEGEEVPVGNVIATIGESKQAPAAAKIAPTQQPSPSPAPQRNSVSMPPTSSAASNGRVNISPLARRIAREKNLDIALMKGTGPNGRIIEADVNSFVPAPAAPVVSKLVQAAPPPPPPAGSKVQELSQMRRVIARRMVQSKTTIPHFYLSTEVDMGEAVALREKLNSLEEGIAKISLNDFVVKASAKALVKFPDVNSIFQNDQLITAPDANVGIAVALDDGLIVPVVKKANTLPLRQLATVAKELINKARAKKLQPAEYSAGTFTVSNLGVFDIDTFIAIIDPSQGAILAVSTIVKKPVVVDDEIVIRQRMNITFSGDHRVIDGATGAKFIQEIKRLLQNPLSLIE
jgi:pyruvate dehydrogenase E2 component (dihydrolipoamide acetyltransferase)